MATTYELIASTTLGSTTTGIYFGSIPQTYDDLVVVVSSRSNQTGGFSDLNILFNTTSTTPGVTGYSQRHLQGSGSAASSATLSNYAVNAIQPAAGNTTSTYGSTEFYIPNYTGSSNKSVSFTCVHETNDTTAYIRAGAALWSNTSAITAISIFGSSLADFVSGTSAHLYGITKA